eukprot:sb/3476969/
MVTMLCLCYHESNGMVPVWDSLSQEPTETSKQPIRTRCLGHVTGYKPIRDQYFLIRSVPALCSNKIKCFYVGQLAVFITKYGFVCHVLCPYMVLCVSRDMPIYGVTYHPVVV